MESRTYFEVSIAKSQRDIGSEEPFNHMDYSTHIFHKIEEINEFLKNKYGDCEREEIEPGWYSYVFENDDISHYPVERWEQEDQVRVDLIVATPVAI
jgi:hypothetical protein